MASTGVSPDTPVQTALYEQQKTPTAETKFPSNIHQAVSFLSHCHTSTLVFSACCLLTCLYLIFGQLALLFFGVVGGVLLHAWWEDLDNSPESYRKNVARRQELGIEVVNRLMQWECSSTKRPSINPDPPARWQTGEQPGTLGLNPALAVSLELVVETVITDYIRWWYSPILPAEEAFPRACRKSLLKFVSSAATQLSRKRPAELFLQFVMNSSSIATVFLSEISLALGPLNSESTSISSSIAIYLEEQPESGLAIILSQEEQQKRLEIMADEVLKMFLESVTYDCEPVHIFLREILVGVIFESTIKACSAPDYINSWIIHLLEAGEPEFLNAIDAGLDALEQTDSGKLVPRLSFEATDADSSTADLPSSNWKARDDIYMEVPNDPTSEREASWNRNLDGTSGSEQYDLHRDLTDNAYSELTMPATSLVKLSSTSESHNGGDVNSSKLCDANSTSRPPDSLDGSQVSKSSQEYSTLSKTSLQDRAAEAAMALPLTRFHNASVSILEDWNESGIARSKPNVEYLIQIEPSGSHLVGWMIARKYSDFELLHETLRRISVVSGIAEFSIQHSELPGWKNRNASDLREVLEEYLKDALSHERLAECEGMKRFLQKGTGTGSQSTSTPLGMGFAFRNPNMLENVGKGVLGVISTAPKGVAEGGRAMLGGVSGLFGSVNTGAKRSGPVSRTNSVPKRPLAGRSRSSISDLPSGSTSQIQPSGGEVGSARLEPVRTAGDEYIAQPHSASADTSDNPHFGQDPPDPKFPTPVNGTPPPPFGATMGDKIQIGGANETGSPGPSCDRSDHCDFSLESTNPTTDATERGSTVRAESNAHPPLTEEETTIIVELLFAVVNEVYGLSSAWKFRKRLLNAAKTFLIRPKNPNLDAIRILIQESIIEKNISSNAIADYINTIRESFFQTQEGDSHATSQPTGEGDGERLRERARHLLITNGMPPALVSLMGTNATAEALGRIFDSLQVESVARGFACAVLLQAMKVIVQ